MLNTVDDIVEALGGTGKAAAILGIGPPAVSNWRRFGRIPADKYLIITRELLKRGHQPSLALFGFAGEAAA